MPESMASVMGAFSPESLPKKKLKKVGDHWEDEAGVKYADPDGNQALKMDMPENETQQAAAGAPATSVMGAFGIDKATGTAGWGLPDAKPRAEKYEWDTSPTKKSTQENSSDSAGFEEYFSTMYPDGLPGTGKDDLKARWDQLTDAEKESWLEHARQRAGKKKA